jgi:hypothetical protein
MDAIVATTNYRTAITLNRSTEACQVIYHPVINFFRDLIRGEE